MADRRSRGTVLWSAMGPYRIRFLFAVLLILIDTAFTSLGIGIVLPLLQELLDPDLESELLTTLFPTLKSYSPQGRILALAGLTSAVFAVKMAFSLWATVATNALLFRLRIYWIGVIGQNYLLKPYPHLVRIRQGELLNNWFNETVSAMRFCQSYLRYLSSSALVAALLVLGLLVHWQATLLMAGIGIVMVVLLIKSGLFRLSTRFSDQRVTLNQQVTMAMMESLANAKELKTMSAERSRLRQIDDMCDDLRSVSLKAAILADFPRVSGEFLAILSMMCFLVVGTIYGGYSTVEILPIMAFFFLAFYRVVTASSVALTSRIKATNEWRSVQLVEEVASTVGSRQENLENGDPIQQISGDIIFEEVNFAYPESDFDHGEKNTVLDRIQCTIPRGKIIFLVGGSGAGKSTMLDLLLRLCEPSSGNILMAGKGISQFKLPDWRRCFGYVGQEASLFNGTIRMNLTMPQPDANESEMRYALDLAGASEFVDKMPDGLDTLVGDRGVTLSGGQRKRIAIAQALMIKPSVLILDEATTSFQQSLEKRLLLQVRAVLPDATLIQVTHRLQTIEHADWVIWMEHGRILACGPPDKVVADHPELLAPLRGANSSSES